MIITMTIVADSNINLLQSNSIFLKHYLTGRKKVKKCLSLLNCF